MSDLTLMAEVADPKFSYAFTAGDGQPRAVLALSSSVSLLLDPAEARALAAAANHAVCALAGIEAGAAAVPGTLPARPLP